MIRVAQDRHAAVEGFCRAHRTELERRVTLNVTGAGFSTVEDCCQFAWTVLLRRPDVTLDHRGFGWLTRVATHEGWRIVRTADLPAGSLPGGVDRVAPGLAHVAPLDELTVAREDHEARRALFVALKAVERQALGLQAVGYSYAEIGALTGSSYTAVNRRLTEGRAHLRAKLELERIDPSLTPACRAGGSGPPSPRRRPAAR